MTVQDAVTQISARTNQNDVVKIITELNFARRWAFDRIFAAEGGPNCLMTFGVELTTNAYTRELDLADELSENEKPETIVGIKRLGLKLAGDATYTAMVKRDGNDPEFAVNDQWEASDTSHYATGYPVMYDVFNFTMVRFSPALPSGADIRVDYFRTPPDLDPAANNTVDLGEDLPSIVLDAVIAKATATVFDLLDDDRAGGWESRAEQRLRSAISTLINRVQGPTRITGYRARARRVLV